MRRTLFAALWAGLMIAAGSAQGAPGVPCIGVIPAGGGHVFWNEVENGARRAGRALGIDIYFRGPNVENQVQAQRSVIEVIERMECSAVVIAPTGGALGEDVTRLRKRGIPVVYFDREYEGAPVAAVVATDNYRAGQLAGETLADMLPRGGKVGLLRMRQGVQSTDAREAGFLSAMKARGVQVLLETWIGDQQGNARDRVRQALADLKQPVDGVFAPNEATSLATVAALRQAGLAGRVKFVGFDASPAMLAAMRAGDVAALVVQRPERMGYESVMRAWQAAQQRTGMGQPVIRVDTGVFLVDPAHLDTPAMREALASHLAP